MAAKWRAAYFVSLHKLHRFTDEGGQEQHASLLGLTIAQYQIQPLLRALLGPGVRLAPSDVEDLQSAVIRAYALNEAIKVDFASFDARLVGGPPAEVERTVLGVLGLGVEISIARWAEGQPCPVKVVRRAQVLRTEDLMGL